MTRIFTRNVGPNFQEGPEACKMDPAHDPKAHLAEQTTYDGPLEGKEEVCALCEGLHFVAGNGYQYI